MNCIRKFTQIAKNSKIIFNLKPKKVNPKIVNPYSNISNQKPEKNFKIFSNLRTQEPGKIEKVLNPETRPILRGHYILYRFNPRVTCFGGVRF